jgi:LPS sulfotransferase NodH
MTMHSKVETKPPIIIISQPRSGSTLLQSYLGQVQGVLAFGEIFKRKQPNLQRLARFLEAAPDAIARLQELRLADVAAFWDALQRTLAPAGYRPAAKIFYAHLPRDSALWEKFESAVVLHLVRENILAAVVSHHLAARAQKWRTEAYDKSYDAEPVTVTEAECEQHLADLRANIAWVRERYGKRNYSEYAYETIADLKSASALLSKALGVSVALQWGQEQQRQRALGDVVANYEAVSRFDRNFELLGARPLPA